MAVFAGVGCTVEQIRGTVKLIRYYRQFIRSNYEKCHDPTGQWASDPLTKDRAQRRLTSMIHLAINRKAGIPEVSGRKQESIYQLELRRDCDEIREHRRRRRRLWGLNGRRFRTDEIQARYGHLLADNDDY
jgi:hypothetical protein